MNTAFLTTAIFTFLTSLATSLPTNSSFCTPPSDVFYLVTTSYPVCSSNSSLLPSVSATSTFAPAHQPTLLIRTIGPGYFLLPNFTFADGSLHTVSDGPFGAVTQLYNSTTPADGEELGFVAEDKSNGGLSLVDGYLLANGGDTEGWRLCVGSDTLGEAVLVWKGTDPSCNATYVQAVNTPPY